MRRVCFLYPSHRSLLCHSRLCMTHAARCGNCEKFACFYRVSDYYREKGFTDSDCAHGCFEVCHARSFPIINFSADFPTAWTVSSFLPTIVVFASAALPRTRCWDGWSPRLCKQSSPHRAFLCHLDALFEKWFFPFPSVQSRVYKIDGVERRKRGRFRSRGWFRSFLFLFRYLR